MYQFFTFWQIHNPVVQAKLAVTMFNKNAATWWIAHMQRQPRLLVTYDQLLEWLKYKLTPSAGLGATQLAWHELSYNGNIEKYMAELTKLFL